MRASRKAPAKAIPATTSGRSSGPGAAAAAARGARYGRGRRGRPPGRSPSRGPGEVTFAPDSSRRAAARGASVLELGRSASAACSARLRRPRPRPARRAPWPCAPCARASPPPSRRPRRPRGPSPSPPRRAGRRSRASSARSSAPRASASVRSAWACGLARRGRRPRASAAAVGAGRSVLVRRRVPLLGALGVVVSHSGGSSPKMRRKTTAATRVVTIEARAPMPASRPDQARRLTRSLSLMAAVGSMRRGRRRWSGRRGPWPARTPPRPRRAARRSSR